jgi:hypothetical protein
MGENPLSFRVLVFNHAGILSSPIYPGIVIFAMFFLLKTMALPEFRVYHKNSKEPSWKVYRQ